MMLSRMDLFVCFGLKVRAIWGALSRDGLTNCALGLNSGPGTDEACAAKGE